MSKITQQEICWCNKALLVQKNVSPSNLWWWPSPCYWGFLENVWPIIPRLRSFSFWVKISSRTQNPLSGPGSVHSSSVSWDDCGRMFSDRLYMSSFLEAQRTFQYMIAVKMTHSIQLINYLDSNRNVFYVGWNTISQRNQVSQLNDNKWHTHTHTHTHTQTHTYIYTHTLHYTWMINLFDNYSILS